VGYRLWAGDWSDGAQRQWDDRTTARCDAISSCQALLLPLAASKVLLVKRESIISYYRGISRGEN